MIFGFSYEDGKGSHDIVLGIRLLEDIYQCKVKKNFFYHLIFTFYDHTKYIQLRFFLRRRVETSILHPMQILTFLKVWQN